MLCIKFRKLIHFTAGSLHPLVNIPLSPPLWQPPLHALFPCVLATTSQTMLVLLPKQYCKNCTCHDVLKLFVFIHFSNLKIPKDHKSCLILYTQSKGTAYHSDTEQNLLKRNQMYPNTWIRQAPASWFCAHVCLLSSRLYRSTECGDNPSSGEAVIVVTFYSTMSSGPLESRKGIPGS